MQFGCVLHTEMVFGYIGVQKRVFLHTGMLLGHIGVQGRVFLHTEAEWDRSEPYLLPQLLFHGSLAVGIVPKSGTMPAFWGFFAGIGPYSGTIPAPKHSGANIPARFNGKASPAGVEPVLHTEAETVRGGEGTTERGRRNYSSVMVPVERSRVKGLEQSRQAQ